MCSIEIAIKMHDTEINNLGTIMNVVIRRAYHRSERFMDLELIVTYLPIGVEKKISTCKFLSIKIGHKFRSV